MRGVIAHISNPNRSTACTIALNNNPDTCGFAPYYTKILNNSDHFFLAFLRFTTTAGQPLSDAVRIW